MIASTFKRYQTIERNIPTLGSLYIILSLMIIPAFRCRLTGCGITVFLALVLFGATNVLATAISFTYVPDYGTKNNLKGKVDDPDYKVIEFSRWGTPLNDNGQYVIQPWYVTGNRQRFNVIHNGLDSMHSFTWNPQSINFQSYYSDETSIQT